ncbi:uncharacterized protein M6B38_396670 [Iris pallida]|uniref:Uncharacterized protein n=1 Tax=Iris pallida TaxID=29817 RepID=A0AAX6FX51_IRIPA|nr:uncharacterized protein M6B38_396670 [Iris pallida]
MASLSDTCQERAPSTSIPRSGSPSAPAASPLLSTSPSKIVTQSSEAASPRHIQSPSPPPPPPEGQDFGAPTSTSSTVSIDVTQGTCHYFLPSTLDQSNASGALPSDRNLGAQPCPRFLGFSLSIPPDALLLLPSTIPISFDTTDTVVCFAKDVLGASHAHPDLGSSPRQHGEEEQDISVRSSDVLLGSLLQDSSAAPRESGHPFSFQTPFQWMQELSFCFGSPSPPEWSEGQSRT